MLTKALPPELQRLEAAAHGLLIQSETDAPLVPFFCTTSEWNAIECAPAGAKHWISVSEFFTPYMEADSEWMGADEIAVCERYRVLCEMCERELHEARVLKIGDKAERQVYIRGYFRGGVGGLKTKVVET